ncbi:hypothetical protein X742_01475 [Mesorhizobium sp. LNHC232B00]|nr:hypothetical protein X742_01475 [Mesorhizobium sp. LNHC232B00]
MYLKRFQTATDKSLRKRQFSSCLALICFAQNSLPIWSVEE